MLDFIIKYWLEAAFAGITALAAFAFRELRKRLKADEEKRVRQETELGVIKEGLQALLRSEIIAYYNRYMERGSIPIYAMENVHELYARYHALGGNGTVTKLIDKLGGLPQPVEDEKT